MPRGIKKTDPRPSVATKGGDFKKAGKGAALGSGNVGKRDLGTEDLSDQVVKRGKK